MTPKESLAKLAHDLRTPLSVIKINLEVSLLDDVDPTLRKSLQSNMEELDRMSKMIDEFQRSI
jgi:two-component system, OmpR family, heavy metal sensor histidine kinase CusS